MKTLKIVSAIASTVASTIALTIVSLTLISAADAQGAFNQCYISYSGCKEPGSKCMPLIKGHKALVAAIVKTYSLAPDHALLLGCDNWNKWKAVESFKEFVPLFDQYAKHWWVNVNGERVGPVSRDQLNAMKAEGTLTFDSKIWSGVRMGPGSKYRKAGDVPEIYFNVISELPGSDDEVIY